MEGASRRRASRLNGQACGPETLLVPPGPISSQSVPLDPSMTGRPRRHTLIPVSIPPAPAPSLTHEEVHAFVEGICAEFGLKPQANARADGFESYTVADSVGIPVFSIRRVDRLQWIVQVGGQNGRRWAEPVTDAQSLERRVRAEFFRRADPPEEDLVMVAANGTVDGYRIVGPLGSGGMGIVEEATRLQRVAIKRLKNTGERDGAERLLREARLGQMLTSEHAVRIIEAGRDSVGQPFVVMEFLDGRTLEEELQKSRPLAFEDIKLWVVQACEAVAEAHMRALVHRDLKPDNMFLTRRPDGSPCVKVLDFGIAKNLASEERMTATNARLGTTHYSSPEQCRSTKSVDRRTDIWSLGATLYRLSTGHFPFEGDAPEHIEGALLRICTEPHPQAQTHRRDIPEQLVRVIDRCLQKNPADRYQTVSQLVADLCTPTDPQTSRLVALVNTFDLLGGASTVPIKRSPEEPVVPPKEAIPNEQFFKKALSTINHRAELHIVASAATTRAAVPCTISHLSSNAVWLHIPLTGEPGMPVVPIPFGAFEMVWEDAEGHFCMASRGRLQTVRNGENNSLKFIA